jgi:hypothetical protein
MAALLIGPASASANDEEPNISIAGSGALAVEGEEGEPTLTGHLTIFNTGAADEAIELALQPSGTNGVEVESFAPQSIAAGSAERVAIVFDGFDDLDEIVTGQLVLSGDTELLSRDVSLTPAAQPAAPWPEVLIVVALAVTLGLMLVVLGAVPRESRAQLRKRATGPKWTFASWASILTALGAVLGTVLTGVTLPEVVSQIDKETLVELNLLFLALIAVAPFAFYAVRARDTTEADQAAGLTGYNAMLLFSCCLTCGAVVGQIGTLALLAWELIGGGFWGWFAVAFAGVLALLSLAYGFQTTVRLVVTDWEAIAKADAEAAKKVAATQGFELQPDDLGGPVALPDRVPSITARRPVLP